MSKIFYPIVDDYDSYSEFLKRYNFDARRCWYHFTGIIQTPIICILLKNSRKSDRYQELVSLHRNNRNISFIDYGMERTWDSKARLTMTVDQYNRFYNIFKDDGAKFTFSARINQDYSIRVDFPDEENAFLIGLKI